MQKSFDQLKQILLFVNSGEIGHSNGMMALIFDKVCNIKYYKLPFV